MAVVRAGEQECAYKSVNEAFILVLYEHDYVKISFYLVVVLSYEWKSLQADVHPLGEDSKSL